MTRNQNAGAIKMLALAALVCFLKIFADAAVPSRINFQGKLLDNDGNPRQGNYSMTFRICDTPSSSCASPIWTETQGTVPVSNGVFSVELGAAVSLTSTVFESDARYLEVEIGGETASSRQRLVTTPYAFRAAMAEDLAAGATNYIHNRNTIQTDAVFYVSSGTVAGPLRVEGVIRAGSANHQITTTAGLIDDSKLTGGATHYIQNTSNLQSASTFHVSSGTVAGPLHADNSARVGGVINRNATVTTVSNTSSETTIYSFTLAAGSLETNRALRIALWGSYLNNSGANRTLTVRVKLGGTTILSQTTGNLAASATTAKVSSDIIIMNANNASAQRGVLRWFIERANALLSPLIATSDSIAVNTSIAQTFEVTVQHNAANANLALSLFGAYAVVE